MVQPLFFRLLYSTEPKVSQNQQINVWFLGQVSAFFWFKWVSTSEKTGRSYERLATRDQPVIYPWSTRDICQIPRVHKIKPYVLRTNLGFPQPVINPWFTRVYPCFKTWVWALQTNPELNNYFNGFCLFLKLWDSPRQVKFDSIAKFKWMCWMYTRLDLRPEGIWNMETYCWASRLKI